MTTLEPHEEALSLALAGSWHLARSGEAEGLPCAVPGDVHSALLAAGRIPDPMWGENERDVQWVGEADWTLGRSFDLPPDALAGRWPVLDLTVLDTVAEVVVNGVTVAEAASAFQRHRVDLDGRLRAGTNTVEFRFRSAAREAAERAERLPFPVPYSLQNNRIPHLNTLRKPQCHGGWDWGPALMVLGIYEAPVLRLLRAARIEHAGFTQEHAPDGRVTVTAEVELAARPGRAAAGPPEPVAATLRIAGATASGTVEFDRAGAGRCRVSVTLDRPALWWPAGCGAQHLHDVTVSIPGDRVVRRIGLRRAEVAVSDDGGMAVRVNGRAVFCRGANWIPADALPARATPERVRRLLGEAREANMNMVRVWGGGFYESEAFYDACDVLGLMVWQDLMFACSQYPATPAFLAEVDAEVRYQVKRLSAHPCIVLWCGDNEVIGSLGWYELSRNNRDRYLVNYDRLNRTLELAVTQSDPDRRFWPSSPCKGTLDYGDAWHDDGAGDMHYWSVWHENKPFEAYHTVKPRFCSEFGFQSFPTLPTIRGFAPPEALNATSPVMEWHQRDPAGNARIIETMARLFRMPDGFGDFVFLSQLQQALAIEMAVRHWRSLKPWCMGTLYWQLNDVWPAVSWSSLDHGVRWKSLHHHAKRFFNPLALAPRLIGDRLEVKAVDDGLGGGALVSRVRIFDLAGDLVAAHEARADVPPDRAVTVMDVPAPRPGDTFGVVDARRPHEAVWDPTLQCTVLAGPPKRYAFPGAEVAVAPVAAMPDAFRLTTDRPAFFVMPEFDGRAGAFDDASLLLPGEDRIVRFRPFDAAGPVPSEALPRLRGLGLRAEARQAHSSST